MTKATRKQYTLEFKQEAIPAFAVGQIRLNVALDKTVISITAQPCNVLGWHACLE
jgi:hypothetical protein